MLQMTVNAFWDLDLVNFAILHIGVGPYSHRFTLPPQWIQGSDKNLYLLLKNFIHPPFSILLPYRLTLLLCWIFLPRPLSFSFFICSFSTPSCTSLFFFICLSFKSFFAFPFFVYFLHLLVLTFSFFFNRNPRYLFFPLSLIKIN